MLFRRKAAVLKKPDSTEKHSDLASIGETINLILTHAKTTKMDPRLLLNEIMNKNNEPAFRKDDKLEHFEQTKADLDAIAKQLDPRYVLGGAAREGSATSNESLLEEVIIQEAVNAKWENVIKGLTCILSAHSFMPDSLFVPSEESQRECHIHHYSHLVQSYYYFSGWLSW